MRVGAGGQVMMPGSARRRCSKNLALALTLLLLLPPDHCSTLSILRFLTAYSETTSLYSASWWIYLNRGGATMLGLLRSTPSRLSGSLLPRSLRQLQTFRSYASSSEHDVESMLAKPTWSVRSLLPDSAAKTSPPSVTPKQLHHLLRLSALPQPSSQEEESAMLKTLESQIHFVKEIQRVDTTGIAPLQSVRDESAEAVEENTIGLEHLKEALSKERVSGRRNRIQRIEVEINERPDGNAWDGNALGYTSKTKGPFFVVETSKGNGN